MLALGREEYRRLARLALEVDVADIIKLRVEQHANLTPRHHGGRDQLTRPILMRYLQVNVPPRKAEVDNGTHHFEVTILGSTHERGVSSLIQLQPVAAVLQLQQLLDQPRVAHLGGWRERDQERHKGKGMRGTYVAHSGCGLSCQLCEQLTELGQDQESLQTRPCSLLSGQ